MSLYQFNGTINAGGTLSNEIQIGEATCFGLVVPAGATSSAFGWYVSDRSDADGGVYVPLYNASGAISHGTRSGGFAIDSISLQVLEGHRFVRLQTGSAQTSGIAFRLFGKRG